MLVVLCQYGPQKILILMTGTPKHVPLIWGISRVISEGAMT